MTEMIQLSAMSIAKQTKKQKKPKISSPTRALMKKRKEMIENKIMAWEVEAALRKMKNGKEAGKYQVTIETLKAGDETIAKQLAKLYTKCITERRIP